MRGSFIICILFMAVSVLHAEEEVGTRTVKASPRRLEVEDTNKPKDEFDQFGGLDQPDMAPTDAAPALPLSPEPVVTAPTAPAPAVAPKAVAPAAAVPAKSAVAPVKSASSPAAKTAAAPAAKVMKPAAKPSAPRGPASLTPQAASPKPVLKQPALKAAAKPAAPACPAVDWEPKKNVSGLLISGQDASQAYTFEGVPGVFSPAAGKIVASKASGHQCIVEIEHQSCPGEVGKKGRGPASVPALKCKTEIKFQLEDDNACPQLTKQVDTCTPFAKAKKSLVKTTDPSSQPVTSRYVKK